MYEQVRRAEPMAKELVRLAIAFSEAFAAESAARIWWIFTIWSISHWRFSWMQRQAGARCGGGKFRDMYEEIMIDEYQDSNHVQGDAS